MGPGEGRGGPGRRADGFLAVILAVSGAVCVAGGVLLALGVAACLVVAGCFAIFAGYAVAYLDAASRRVE